MENRVFVTGVGAVTPIGLSVKDYWNSLISGTSGVSNITKFDTTEFSVKIGAEVKNFDPLTCFSPKEVKRADTFVHYGIAAAIEAVKDSGLQFDDPLRAGVIVGSGIGGIETWEREFRKLIESPRRVSPFFIPMMIINSISGEIGIRFGIKGPNFSVVSACASSSHSICDAYRLIKEGLADVVITGGSEAAISPMAVAGFANMRALSTRNDAPTKASRPFDKERDGFIIGEGAGIIVLEEANHAIKRGANPYCELAGVGMSCDAYHITAPDSSGEGAANSMRTALQSAGVKPEDVSYINPHGTSTPLNDAIETKAIKMVFGDLAKNIPISSTKSMTGHLLGAAGAIEIIACALSIRNSMVHPTINLENPDPECDLDYVPGNARSVNVNVAISNSFGFGGHNATLVVKKI
ncbi:MAG: beta-ketoacyl-ACP synthase II [bacterium]